MSKSLLIWVLADVRMGHANQAIGVAEALGLPFEVKQITYSGLASLPNWVRGESLLGVSDQTQADLVAPWPDLIITAGRRTGPVARWVKSKAADEGGRGAFLVQIMYPGASGLEDLDMVAVPNHDDKPSKASNILHTTGAPHRISQAQLDQAAEGWAERIGDLPKPWIALMVGGATKNRQFPVELASSLGQRAADFAKDAGGSLLVTTSPRTGAEQEEAVLDKLVDVPTYVHRWGDPGDNPYYALMALSECIIVTGDSMSMCSEACGTGKGVYIYAPEGMVSAKHSRLHSELYKLGCAKPLAGTFESWTYEPINAAFEVAAAIKEKMGLG